MGYIISKIIENILDLILNNADLILVSVLISTVIGLMLYGITSRFMKKNWKLRYRLAVFLIIVSFGICILKFFLYGVFRSLVAGTANFEYLLPLIIVETTAVIITGIVGFVIGYGVEVVKSKK